MNSGTFFAQDQAGNMQQIRIIRDAAQDGRQGGSAPQAVSYALEDGTPLKRVDNETFQIIDTGAFITLVR